MNANPLPERIDDFFAPATVDTLFWRPRYMVESPALCHVPFLFWLIGATRPQEVAVIGAGDGVASFALAQGLDKLTLPAGVRSYGFWPDKAVPAELSAHREQIYDDSLWFGAARSVEDALEDLGPGGLDAVLLDLTALPEGDKLPQMYQLLEVLRPGGIVLVHGRDRLPGGVAQAGYRVISFPEGERLTVIAPEDVPSPRLRRLLQASQHGRLPAEIAMFFRRLGQGHMATAQAAAGARRNGDLQAVLETTTRAHDESTTALRDLQDALDATRAQLAEAAERASDAELARAELMAHRDALQSKLASLRHLHEESAAVQAETQSELAQIRQVLEEARAAEASERDTRFRETAALARELEQLRAEDAPQAAHLRATMEAEIAALRAERDKAKSEAAEARHVRFEETALLTRDLLEVQGKQEALMREIAVLRKEKQVAETRMREASAKDTEIAALRKERDKAKAELAETRNARFEETALLTRDLLDVRGKHEALSREIDDLRHEKQMAEDRVRELVGSTSWRITAPIRKVKTTLSRS